jgi:hypothetical protein
VGVFIPNITGEGAEGLSATMGNMGGGISQAAIVQVFYIATIIQSIGCGLVSGVFEDGHLESSVKHIFIMIIAGWFVFKVFVGV